MFVVAIIDAKVLHACYDIGEYRDMKLMSKEELLEYLSDCEPLAADLKKLDTVAIGKSVGIYCKHKDIWEIDVIRVS